MFERCFMLHFRHLVQCCCPRILRLICPLRCRTVTHFLHPVPRLRRYVPYLAFLLPFLQLLSDRSSFIVTRESSSVVDAQLLTRSLALLLPAFNFHFQLLFSTHALYPGQLYALRFPCHVTSLAHFRCACVCVPHAFCLVLYPVSHVPRNASHVPGRVPSICVPYLASFLDPLSSCPSFRLFRTVPQMSSSLASDGAIAVRDSFVDAVGIP